VKILRVLRSRCLLPLALLGDVLLYGGPHRAHDPFHRSLDEALAAQADLTEDWLGREGVVGTAIGEDASGRAVVKVYLASPAAAAMLPPSLSGVPVFPEVTGPFRALGDPPAAGEAQEAGPADPAAGVAVPVPGGADDPAARPARVGASSDDEPTDPKRGFPRPVPIGVSTGHPDVTAGTIGARVTDGSRVFALSNNHVFANNNRGRPGDHLLQPGVADGGVDPDDRLATLQDFEPIEFCRGLVCSANRIDAAIAETTADDLSTATPDEGYGAPRSWTREAELGMAVQKYGRTTGYTTGRVSGINATIDVNYRMGTARFEGQVVISGNGFSAGGDSGSLIVSKGMLMQDRRPVGLLFAGSANSTIANPIDEVLDRFGVRIDGGDG